MRDLTTVRVALLALTMGFAACTDQHPADSGPEPVADAAAIAVPAKAGCGLLGLFPCPTTPTPPANGMGQVAASRFLAQATFGPSLTEINALAAAPNFDAWFNTQASAAPCLVLNRLLWQSPTAENRIEAWWQCVVKGNDQLRQRMAFALSEILVSSDVSTLASYPTANAYYQDILTQNALGNFWNLLNAVARSPAMGWYLNMWGSQKPDPVNNIRADENFAREVMQLFTIGLVKLNLDGTPQLSNGQPIPTFTQADVEGMARAFTGWGWAGNQFIYSPTTMLSFISPMQPTAAYHDSTSKTIIGGVVIPAGLDASTELDAVLYTLFQHPNVGPFISRQLIQRLVSSNPSPEYVARVAAVFNNNGGGVRGDLLAVAKAILTDPEARSPTGHGKLREPIIRIAHLWRAFEGAALTGRYDIVARVDRQIGQGPLMSSSVFNFFRPDYKPAGELTASNILAPEAQILDSATMNSFSTLATGFAWSIRWSRGAPPFYTVSLNALPYEAMAADPATLVSTFDLILTGASTSPEVLSLIQNHIATIPASLPDHRIPEALTLLLASPLSLAQK